MRGWQDPGQELEPLPDWPGEGHGEVPAPAGPFKGRTRRGWAFWAGPDRVEIRVVRYVEGDVVDNFVRGQLLTREGWVDYEPGEQLPATVVLGRREALRRRLVAELLDDLHVRSPNVDGCWRCGLRGDVAWREKEEGRLSLCPGWTENGIWALESQVQSPQGVR